MHAIHRLKTGEGRGGGGGVISAQIIRTVFKKSKS